MGLMRAEIQAADIGEKEFKCGGVNRGAAEPPKLTPLPLAAALEALSEHPLAQAIVEAAEGKGLPRPEVRDFQAVPGKGVEGTLGGKRYRVGRPEWAEELGLKVSEPLKRGPKEAEARGEAWWP